MTFDPRRRLLQGSLGRHGDGEDEPYFVNYIPPARDAITLPRHVIYILVGVVLVVVATYAIVGHLIKDLMHDLADWILGPKPVEVDTERGREVKVDRWNGRVDDRGEKARMETEEEGRVGLLPGYYRPPAPPNRSSMSAFPGEKRSSHQNVTFALPVTPYVTSV